MVEVKDRHEELKKIEEDIVELTELYNELFELVANQGNTIPIIKPKTSTAEETETVWALTILLQSSCKEENDRDDLCSPVFDNTDHIYLSKHLWIRD